MRLVTDVMCQDVKALLNVCGQPLPAYDNEILPQPTL